MKKWLLFASAMCLVIVLAACGTNKGNEGTAASPTDSVETSAGEGGAAAGEIVITASNYKFDKSEYKIKAGEATNIKLDSIDGLHGLQIRKTEYNIPNGKTVAVTIAEPGEYEIICNVPCGSGHTKMKTKLIVV